MEELKEISIGQVRVNPHQPRRHFSPEELEELAESIKELGLIHPPLVRPLEGGQYYELVSGERRLRATQLAGFDTIKVIVRDSSEILSAQQALVENIQRVDVEESEGITQTNVKLIPYIASH
jgi:ParB family chromosome partitioning protein